VSGRIVHLLRHAAVERPGRFLGRTDEPCTEGGIATCLARAGNIGFARIVSSPLMRAADVAARIGAVRGLTVEQDPAWMELDFGAWEGRSAADIGAASLRPFYDDPDAAPPPGGERWTALTRRVDNAIARLDERPTLVVTHGGPMRAALASLCGFDRRQIWAFDLPYAALLSLRLYPGAPVTAQIIGLST
jgi:alpha-ribazole phosphatase